MNTPVADEGRVVCAKLNQSWPRWFPYALCLLLLLPSVFWIAADNAVWPWDQAWYGDVSARLWFTLTHKPSHWFQEILRAFKTKAPGVAWVGQFGVPIGRATGSIEFGLLLTLLATQFATLILVFKTTTALWPGRRALHVLAVLIVSAAPLFVAMSHEYFAEPLQLFSVVYFYWLAVRCWDLNRGEVIGHLLLATGIAMLAKATSPLYCAGPGAIALWSLLSRRSTEPVSQRPSVKTWLVLSAGVVIFFGMVAWYVKNFSAVLDFVKLASSSDVALDYGKVRPFWSKVGFWLTTSQRSFFLPLVLGAIAVALAAVLIRNAAHFRGICSKAGWNRNYVILMAAFVHCLLVLIFFSRAINEESRYLLPLLPSLLLLLLCVVAIGWRWVPLSLCLLFFAQWAFVNVQSLNLGEATQPQHLQRIGSFGISKWLRACQRDRQQKTELENVIRLTTTPATKYRMHICGVEVPWLNANSLSFYASKESLTTGYRCSYTSLGYAQKDIKDALQVIDRVKAVYFISLTESAQPAANFVNVVSGPALKMVRSDPRFVQEPFDSKLGLVVFRNTQQKLK